MLFIIQQQKNEANKFQKRNSHFTDAAEYLWKLWTKIKMKMKSNMNKISQSTSILQLKKKKMLNNLAGL